jgi:predicted nuclease of predicted toxin-antitoxin system
VAAGEQADEDALEHVGLADDDLAHLGGERVDEGALLGDQLVQAARTSCMGYVKPASRAAFVVFDSPVLDVTFVEARGEDTPETLGAVLEDTAFYAQSTLLGVACDVGDPEAPKALRTLAHMVVAWDEDWSDLFLLQLASPDPLIRHEAVTSTSIAAMVAQESAAALVLLREAESHEKYPKLKETLGEAIRLLEAASGSPLTLA